ncbi:aminoacyl-tRNA hydrolase [bacterium]|nr:aminoacyl-tRNA hydrolase [bacterium]
MQLIVGLGNPGRRYSGTWHNLGARTVGTVVERWKELLKPGKGEFLYADARRHGGKIVLLIPTSYMNRSGGPVVEWMNYYRLDPSDLLIIYDDHDLPLGRIRLRETGSSGGHRGMDDIIRLTGSEDILRLRIGIQTDRERTELSHQVLSKIPAAHTAHVDRIIDIAADAVEMMISEGVTVAMNHFNRMEII